MSVDELNGVSNGGAPSWPLSPRLSLFGGTCWRAKVPDEKEGKVGGAMNARGGERRPAI